MDRAAGHIRDRVEQSRRGPGAVIAVLQVDLAVIGRASGWRRDVREMMLRIICVGPLATGRVADRRYMPVGRRVVAESERLGRCRRRDHCWQRHHIGTGREGDGELIPIAILDGLQGAEVRARREGEIVFGSVYVLIDEIGPTRYGGGAVQFFGHGVDVAQRHSIRVAGAEELVLGPVRGRPGNLGEAVDRRRGDELAVGIDPPRPHSTINGRPGTVVASQRQRQTRCRQADVLFVVA